jgi:hypothetical protein
MSVSPAKGGHAAGALAMLPIAFVPTLPARMALRIITSQT